MKTDLSGKKIAILVDNGFEQVEMTEPQKALEKAGAETHIVSLQKSKVKGWAHTKWGKTFTVNVPIKKARAVDYDALLLPGGVMNPDNLRNDTDAVTFVKGFVKAGKPIAAICHGPWTLINAGAVKGRRMTSYPSIQMDLKNAGARWVDQEVVVDGNFVTSRKPNDIPAFNKKMIEQIGKTKILPSKTAKS